MRRLAAASLCALALALPAGCGVKGPPRPPLAPRPEPAAQSPPVQPAAPVQPTPVEPAPESGAAPSPGDGGTSP